MLAAFFTAVPGESVWERVVGTCAFPQLSKLQRITNLFTRQITFKKCN